MQFLVANFSKYLDSSFKIQGSEKTSSIQPLCVQDSGFKAQKKLLQPHLFGLKIQDSRLKAQKKLLQPHLFGFKVQDSRLRKNFFNPTSLDSRFKAYQDSKFKAEGLRVQEVFLGSWILNPTPLGSRSLLGIWNLESWIRCT